MGVDAGGGLLLPMVLENSVAAGKRIMLQLGEIVRDPDPGWASTCSSRA
ncbi:hypothetical protein [Planobispora longispora]